MDALFLVARCAVLVAGHSHQDQREQQAKQPADNSEQDPGNAQIRPLPIRQIFANSAPPTDQSGVTAS